MSLKLTEEQRQAVLAGRGAPVPIEDDLSHTFYVLVDRETHDRQAAALRLQEELAAIQAGIDNMEAGKIVPFEQVDARIRQELGLPAR